MRKMTSTHTHTFSFFKVEKSKREKKGKKAEEKGNWPKGCTSVNQKSGVDFGQRTLIMRIQINVGWINPAVYVLCCVYTHVVNGDAHT